MKNKNCDISNFSIDKEPVWNVKGRKGGVFIR